MVHVDTISVFRIEIKNDNINFSDKKDVLLDKVVFKLCDKQIYLNNTNVANLDLIFFKESYSMVENLFEMVFFVDLNRENTALTLQNRYNLLYNLAVSDV